MKRQFKLMTGLTGLLVATGVHSLMSEPGQRWVGSAYAQESESWDADADAQGESSDEAAAEEAFMDDAPAGDDEWAGAEEEEESDADADSAATSGANDPAEAAPEAPAAAPVAAPEAQPPTDKVERVRQALYASTREIVPGLDGYAFRGSDTLRNLGANSIDRSEIIMMTMEKVGVSVTRTELAKAESLDELAQLIASKMP